MGLTGWVGSAGGVGLTGGGSGLCRATTGTHVRACPCACSPPHPLPPVRCSHCSLSLTPPSLTPPSPPQALDKDSNGTIEVADLKKFIQTVCREAQLQVGACGGLGAGAGGERGGWGCGLWEGGGNVGERVGRRWRPGAAVGVLV